MVRRKALFIMGFTTPDRPLTRVETAYNAHYKAQGKAQISAALSTDFLITRDKQNKRPGFLEIELKAGETPMAALRRCYPWSVTAVISPWVPIENFSYSENDNDWQIQLGLIGMHPDQRGMDLSEQSDELPYTVEWQRPLWLFQQNEEGLLNLITSTALSHGTVRQFLLDLQGRMAA